MGNIGMPDFPLVTHRLPTHKTVYFPPVKYTLKNPSTAYAMEMPIIIRPYTHNELALLYGISWKTFKRWLKPYEEQIGPKVGHFYCVNQVKIIFECLGPPQIPLVYGK